MKSYSHKLLYKAILEQNKKYIKYNYEEDSREYSLLKTRANFGKLCNSREMAAINKILTAMYKDLILPEYPSKFDALTCFKASGNIFITRIGGFKNRFNVFCPKLTGISYYNPINKHPMFLEEEEIKETLNHISEYKIKKYLADELSLIKLGIKIK